MIPLELPGFSISHLEGAGAHFISIELPLFGSWGSDQILNLNRRIKVLIDLKDTLASHVVDDPHVASCQIFFNLEEVRQTIYTSFHLDTLALNLLKHDFVVQVVEVVSELYSPQCWCVLLFTLLWLMVLNSPLLFLCFIFHAPYSDADSDSDDTDCNHANQSDSEKSHSFTFYLFYPH